MLVARWSKGAEVIERLLGSRQLETVTGGSADGTGNLAEAEIALSSATQLTKSDPRTAYIAAYDAARLSLVGLLLQQGLRPTVSGGHICIGEAIGAQFGSGFSDFDAMRRRRNELEYPISPHDRSCAPAEAEAGARQARVIIDKAGALIGELTFFNLELRLPSG